MERRLAAILAADVVGYSRLMAEDQSGTLAALRALRDDLFNPTITQHAGRLVKSMGDGWLVEFPAISDAAACAIFIQQQIALNHEIKLRIGIHIGEVVIESDDVFGDGVNIAARLEALAEPGQILLSGLALQSLDGKTAALFGGGAARSLKNIPNPMAVWHWPVDSGFKAAPSAEKDPAARRAQTVIAVIPFNNRSNDPEQDYFSDGISEDIITELGRSRTLKPLPKSATFKFKGQTIDHAELGESLGADIILEGSVRRSGDRIRISAELTECRSGTQRWAERYDRDISDLFAVQDDITESIVSALNAEIDVQNMRETLNRQTDSVDAYDLNLLAVHHYFKFTVEDNIKALDYAKRATLLDPNFALAWCAVSISHRQLVEMHWTDDYEMELHNCRDAAQRAVAADPSHAHPYQTLSIAEARSGNDIEAMAAIEKSIAINPHRGIAYTQLAQVHMFAGRYQEGLDAIAEAYRRDGAHAPMWYYQIEAVCLSGIGRYDEAERAIAKALSGMAGVSYVQMTKANILSLAGKLDEARLAMDKALELSPNLTFARVLAATPAITPDSAYVSGLKAAGLE